MAHRNAQLSGVSLPNDLDALPGEQITLYYYDESRTPDPASNQWRVMGLGTVSEDGKSIVSNPNARTYVCR